MNHCHSIPASVAYNMPVLLSSFREQLNSLMTHNFQTFNPASFWAA